ncbi:purine-cytosine permease family protein [Mycolicibacterium komossense]|uniref:Cytosine permease n=1 Tax=Mycolicibacterium komossense TaxID=1779 RepID=A0ABT3CIN1_9MYCO|nr:cytosine permease [Mycolicibacterium komossense]MCV7229359.1 cytosine permease [Mycolicibacterium komossense]
MSITESPGPATRGKTLAVETNGINPIAEHERKGKPRDLFWPWFAANVSVLSVSYGSFVLAFGMSVWQALAVVLVGVIASNLLCGYIATAGRRGSAPTMTLSRSAFGVRGNRLPSLLSWMLTVGWETSLVVVAVLATSTIFERLGWTGGVVVKVVALLVVVTMIVAGGMLGFDVIMRLQRWLTVLTAVLTALYIAFTINQVDWHALAALPPGGTPIVIGAILFVMTGFGLGWVNAAADYSRYLPRTASSKGIVGWTTLGCSLPPAVLLIYGVLLAGSSSTLNEAIASDPVGALTTILPTWFLIPFAVVTVVGLVAGAIMDIYSSGLALLNVGLKTSRVTAVGVDALIMLLGAIAVVFFSPNFIGPFQGFLITLGVPITAWCGIFIADLALRRGPYAERDLFDPRGRYGDIRWMPIALIAIATVIGWGLVTNSMAPWLAWQGYLLGPLGLGGKDGAWAFSNLGVIVALVIGLGGYLLLGRRTVRAQESLPVGAEFEMSNTEAQQVGLTE